MALSQINPYCIMGAQSNAHEFYSILHLFNVTIPFHISQILKHVYISRITAVNKDKSRCGHIYEYPSRENALFHQGSREET